MSTKHTPGPLHVVTSNSWPFDISIFDAQGAVVDVLRLPAHSTAHKTFADALNYRGIDHSEASRCREANQRALADAHLRATAPELLAALQASEKALSEALTLLMNSGLVVVDTGEGELMDVEGAVGRIDAAIDSAREVVAKATGEQQ